MEQHNRSNRSHLFPNLTNANHCRRLVVMTGSTLQHVAKHLQIGIFYISVPGMKKTDLSTTRPSWPVALTGTLSVSTPTDCSSRRDRVFRSFLCRRTSLFHRKGRQTCNIDRLPAATLNCKFATIALAEFVFDVESWTLDARVMIQKQPREKRTETMRSRKRET